MTMSDRGSLEEGALEHALEHHTTKLLSLAAGVGLMAAGAATSTLEPYLLGVLFLSLGIGQLVAYWRHDHAECDHPACAAVEEER